MQRPRSYRLESALPYRVGIAHKLDHYPSTHKCIKSQLWTAEFISLGIQQSDGEIERWKSVENERLKQIRKQIERQRNERERKRGNEKSRVPGPGSVSRSRTSRRKQRHDNRELYLPVSIGEGFEGARATA